MKKIAIFIAMLAEAQSIITRYNMTQKKADLNDDRSFICINSCIYKKIEILLITPGIDPRYQVDRVGPVPAALATWDILHRLKPSILINAGTAGGFAARGANVGDVYLAKSPVKYYDRRISLDNFKEYGVGSFECLSLSHAAKKLGLKQGQLLTGSSLDKSAADLEELNYRQADLKEMEAAAIAEACYLSNFSDVIFIKAITNLLDMPEESSQQFQKNLRQASDNLASELYKLIDELIKEKNV